MPGLSGVLYTPTGSYTGSDSFTYTIEDENGNFDSTATVNVNVQYPGTISGHVRLDADGNGQIQSGDQGIANRTINVYQNSQLVATTQTASNGSYSVPNLFPGTYTVQQVLPTGWSQTVAPSSSTVTSNNTTTADLGTFQNLTIKGTKYNDLDGDGVQDAGELGLPGWTILLYTVTGGTLSSTPLQTTTTDANGDYSFVNLGPLAAGTKYVVVEDLQSGWVQTSPGPGLLQPFRATWHISPISPRACTSITSRMRPAHFQSARATSCSPMSISTPTIRPARSCCNGMMAAGTIVPIGARTTLLSARMVRTAAATWAACPLLRSRLNAVSLYSSGKDGMMVPGMTPAPGGPTAKRGLFQRSFRSTAENGLPRSHMDYVDHVTRGAHVHFLRDARLQVCKRRKDGGIFR